MISEKCRERLNSYKARRDAGEVDVVLRSDATGTNDDLFYAGWRMHENSLCGSRIGLRGALDAIIEQENCNVSFTVIRAMAKAIEACGGSPVDLSKVIPKYLAPYLPIRIILHYDDRDIKGVVENSFSMGTSDTAVRIWWSGKAYSFLGEHVLSGIDDAAYNAKGDLVFDPLDPLCPVEIDWASWLVSTDKYDRRNAPFAKKVFVREEDDARFD